MTTPAKIAPIFTSPMIRHKQEKWIIKIIYSSILPKAFRRHSIAPSKLSYTSKVLPSPITKKYQNTIEQQ